MKNLIMALSVITLLIASFNAKYVFANSLPDVIFLGDSLEGYDYDPNYEIIAKFVTEGVTKYTIVGSDRDLIPQDGVLYWATTDSSIIFSNIDPEQEHPIPIVLEDVTKACVVNYVFIDDNVDGRRNFFSIDGTNVHTHDEGMVVYGSFRITQDGVLSYNVQDNVRGDYEIVCPDASGAVVIIDEPVETESFKVTKKVRIQGDDSWGDKVVNVEAGDIIEFKIKIKNKSNNMSDNMRYEDFLPEEMSKVGGSGLTEYWDDHDGDSSKTFIIKAVVNDDEFEGNIDKCIVNKVEVEKDGDFVGSDTATVCYSTVEITELPNTGSVHFVVGVLFILGGFGLRRKYS